MMLRMASTLIVAAWCVAAPGPKERAESHYKAGFELSAHKKWIEALAEYKEAIAIVERELEDKEKRRILPAIRYEVGLAAEHIPGGTAIAIDAFERYLEEPPERPNAEARAHAQRFVGRSGSEVGRIIVKGPAGAHAIVDRDLDGDLPLRRPFVVMPGAHTIEVAAAGYVPEPARMNALAAAGQTVEVDAGRVLAPKPAPTATMADSLPPVLRRVPSSRIDETHLPSEPRPERAIGWPWLAGGAAAIAVGLVVDLAPSSAHDGKLEATDFLPLLFYIGGAACLGWFAWNLLEPSP
jgi:hypothetical protein